MTKLFSARAYRTLALARKEADRLKHNYVGTEHLLLGMIKLGEGVAVTVLQKRGLHLEDVRVEIENRLINGLRPNTDGYAPYTPRSKKVLAFAVKEAKSLRHTYVGTEHLLLGLLREGGGLAADPSIERGVEIERTRNEILKELDPNFTPGAENIPGREATMRRWLQKCGRRGSGDERQTFSLLRHNFAHPGQKNAAPEKKISQFSVIWPK